MTKDEILTLLQQNCDVNGISQFNFSHDSSIKVIEQDLLKNLETERLIQKLTAALGYAVYQFL